MGKCVFNRKWLDEAKFKNWVREFKGDKHSALCCMCNKIIDLGKMGEYALSSHARSKKHISISSTHERSTVTLSEAFRTNPTGNASNSTGIASSSTDELTIHEPTTASSRPTVSSFVSRNDTLSAEILWTMRTVTQHCSFSSNGDLTKLFPIMFPDSEIAKKFSCGERKTSYVAIFGIAEHIKTKLFTTIRGHYSVLFDESLNKSKQMDIHVRYWDDSSNTVCTRYFGSQFMGHASATDMVEHFDEAVLQSNLDMQNMVQIGMDGPNVNWKFFKIVSEKLQKDFGNTILNVCSCGLHVLHNSFKAGSVASGWKVDSLLSGIYYLYKDSPTRREDLSKLCVDGKMPLKFCNHRWLENVPVAKRTIEIWPRLVEYVVEVEAKKKPKPTCNSYTVLKQFTKDKLVIAKLEFFKMMASALQPFLSFYQTEKPVLPMMAQDLSNVLKSLLRRFVKSDHLAECDTLEKLAAVDISNKDHLLNYNSVDIGIITDQALKAAAPLSDRQIVDFKMEARDFLSSTCKKMLNKCPLGYSLVRNLSSLDPREMVTNPSECKANFRRVLVVLRNAGKVNDTCDSIMDQFNEFLDTTSSEVFSGFSRQNNRLDVFYHDHMGSPKYEQLLHVVKMVLVMSHGQAVVERGFSVNKEVETVNLTEKALVSRRFICDYVNHCGGVLNVPISTELINYVASARKRYDLYLEGERKQKLTEEQGRKRKSVLEEIDELKSKKKRLRSEIDTLASKADKLAEEAENKGKLTLITQSNCLRKRSKEKEETLQKLEEDLVKKVDLLKQ